MFGDCAGRCEARIAPCELPGVRHSHAVARAPTKTAAPPVFWPEAVGDKPPVQPAKNPLRELPCRRTPFTIQPGD